MTLITLTDLETIIRDRKTRAPAESYTTSLFSEGVNRITQKVGEEAVEVIVAALGETRDKQITEISDLFYHVLVLMTELDISLEDIHRELAARHKK